MSGKYTNQKNVLILISLLKQHGIKKIIASPGSMNIPFVGSVQNDSYFEVYSAPDERSACYMACGMSAESGEAVVLSCTGATASRNYLSGLTEAYYRKLPILAVTAAHYKGSVGHNIPQVIDRGTMINDVVKRSFTIDAIFRNEDEWMCNTQLNIALLELFRNGAGPIHINLETNYAYDIDEVALLDVRKIERVTYGDSFPSIDKYSCIGIFVGAHKEWSKKEQDYLDSFCVMYNAVVLCDRTSNYFGKYRIMPNLVCCQEEYISPLLNFDLMIHIGDISGSYSSFYPREIWRVNPDGEVRDTFRRLTKVFEMEESYFFAHYIQYEKKNNENLFYNLWSDECKRLETSLEEIPFSNIWIAQTVLPKLTSKYVLHLGILNSLRSWNFFDTPEAVRGYCNTGGFGIDGTLSTLVGASLVNEDNVYLGILGDLAFFYDMNSLGNRHVSSNIRIILVNNGCGIEFKNYSHIGHRFGNDADAYIAAAHHYGDKSSELVKHYTQDLGFIYLSASNKNEFVTQLKYFLVEKSEKPILFEIFTNEKDESDALQQVNHLASSPKGKIKSMVKKILGDNGVDTLRKVLKND